jgi:hypothetical protein
MNTENWEEKAAKEFNDLACEILFLTNRLEELKIIERHNLLDSEREELKEIYKKLDILNGYRRSIYGQES